MQSADASEGNPGLPCVHLPDAAHLAGPSVYLAVPATGAHREERWEGGGPPARRAGRVARHGLFVWQLWCTCAMKL